ncbi:MAG: hypothetical protein MZU84_01445 [Sphingobacterium sp.]|nr:hypothetical protein [Sphingobacterium sp.]
MPASEIISRRIMERATYSIDMRYLLHLNAFETSDMKEYTPYKENYDGYGDYVCENIA